MGQLKVLHIFPNFDIGGPQRRFAQIVNGTGEQFLHLIVSINGSLEALNLLPDKSRVMPLVNTWRQGNLIARARRCAETMREARPDLLVTYNWGAIEWALVNLQVGIPHIHIEDGFGPEEADHQLRRRIWGRQLALSRSFSIIVPSRLLKSIAEARWHFPESRICLIPNGIALGADEAKAELGRENLGLPPDGLIVGWAGGLRKEKNVNRLIRAFAGLRSDAMLVLIGDGPEHAAIEAEIKTLGIAERVRLLGSRTDVENLLPLFDILALSSDTEQMPMIVLEAMAAGLPLASTNVGDIANMIAPENKPFLVERSDEALRRALESLLESESLRTRIGAANRKYARLNHSADQMIAAYADIFRRAGASGIRRGQVAA